MCVVHELAWYCLYSPPTLLSFRRVRARALQSTAATTTGRSQVLRLGENHWATALVVHSVNPDMKLYSADSIERLGVHRDVRALSNLLVPGSKNNIVRINMQSPQGSTACGLFALAYTEVYLRRGLDGAAYTQSDQSRMRDHASWPHVAVSVHIVSTAYTPSFLLCACALE